VRPSFKVSAARARAEKLKLGKQSTLRGLASEDGKAEIVRRRARQATAASCLHIFLFFARFFVNSPWFTFSAFRPPVSGFSLSAFQLVASNQVSESNSATARSLLLGFSFGVFHRSQSSNVRWVSRWREVISSGRRRRAAGGRRFFTCGRLT